MAHFEKELERRELYRGRIFTVTTHRVELEDGGEGLRDVVNHSGGACVAALDKEGRVLLVRQYRFAAGRELLELPPEGVELVLTGRDAPGWMLERADYITEMKKLRHPYDRGVAAREGIEY